MQGKSIALNSKVTRQRRRCTASASAPSLWEGAQGTCAEILEDAGGAPVPRAIKKWPLLPRYSFQLFLILQYLWPFKSP